VITVVRPDALTMLFFPKQGKKRSSHSESNEYWVVKTKVGKNAHCDSEAEIYGSEELHKVQTSLVAALIRTGTTTPRLRVRARGTLKHLDSIAAVDI
jgi:hypothetical protein